MTEMITTTAMAHLVGSHFTTLNKYIAEGRLKPDGETTYNGKRSLLFRADRVEEIKALRSAPGAKSDSRSLTPEIRKWLNDMTRTTNPIPGR